MILLHFKRAVRDMLRHRLLNLVTVVTVALTILIAGAIGVFILNIGHFLDNWKQGIRITAYLEEDPGEEARVPSNIQTGAEIGQYQPFEPEALPDAAVAWHPSSADDKNVAVYQYQWNNPSPDKTIQSVTLRYNKDEGPTYGAPVLLGLTAAK